MTITEFTDRFKAVKVKDTEVLFRTEDKKTLEVKGLFYGVKDEEGNLTTPQVGDEPNCVVVQVTELK